MNKRKQVFFKTSQKSSNTNRLGDFSLGGKVSNISVLGKCVEEDDVEMSRSPTPMKSDVASGSEEDDSRLRSPASSAERCNSVQERKSSGGER